MGIVLLKREDDRIHRRSIDVSILGAKSALIQKTKRVCFWRRDAENTILIKILKIANNRDALTLQSRDKELKKSNQCSYY